MLAVVPSRISFPDVPTCTKPDVEARERERARQREREREIYTVFVLSGLNWPVASWRGSLTIVYCNHHSCPTPRRGPKMPGTGNTIASKKMDGGMVQNKMSPTRRSPLRSSGSDAQVGRYAPNRVKNEE